MKRCVIFLLIVCLMLVLVACTGNRLGGPNDGTTPATTDSSTVESGNGATTTSPVEEGTASPNPENDPYWTDNY